MFTKKRKSFLKLLLFLCMGNIIQAFNIKVTNRTKVTATIEVEYRGEVNFWGIKSCQPDKKELKSRKTHTFKSPGKCALKLIRVWVNGRVKARYSVCGTKLEDMKFEIRDNSYKVIKL